MRLLLRNFFSSGLVQNTLLLFLLCFYFPLRSCATLASVCIKSQESSNPAGFQLYFSGYRAVTDRDGFATFQLNDFDNEKKISLLISNGVLWDDSYFSKTKKQAERFISVVRKKKYRFFQMSLVDGSLQMEEKTLERFGFKLPCKDCLVLNVNPDYVEQISLSKMHNSENLLHLPSITLCSKNKIDNLKKVKLLQKNKVKEKHKKVSSLVWIRDKSLVKQPLLLGQHEVLGVKKKIFSVKSPKKKKHKIQVQASLV